MKSSKLISLSLSFLLICIIYFPQHALSCGSCSSPRKGGHPSIKPPVPVPTTPKLPVPPVTVPKLPVPPVAVPKLPVPPVTVPKLPIPPVTVPKLPVPPVSGLPIPPVSGLPIPNVPLPPVSGLPIPNVPLPPVSGLPIPNVPLPPVSGLPIPNVPLPPVSGLPIPNVPLPPVPIVGPVLPPMTKPPATGGKDCPPPSGSGKATCPINTLKLGACVDLLGGLVKINLGDPAVNKCCPLLKGLAEVEAAVCLCTTLKVKALDLKLYVPVALQLLLTCGKNPPPGYTCSI